MKRLTAAATTAGDHVRLEQHFLALAAEYDRKTAEHEALAKVYRSRPNPSETKRPMAPDTAAHCDRFASLNRAAAAAAREMASKHEQMAGSAERR